MLRVIAPDSLREVRDRKPDFILSTGVLMHVPPEDLTNYFAGLTAAANPPDTVGDVGTQHYVQMVNATQFRIWSKAGVALTGAALGASTKC